MTDTAPAYGLWLLAAINAAVFIMFAYSFAKPASGRDWRSLGAFSAFIVALFAEMYGFPLTIYLLSGWLQSRYPGLDLLSHDTGHLWWDLMGQRGNPHFGLLHILSNLLIFVTLVIMATARFLRPQRLSATGWLPRMLPTVRRTKPTNGKPRKNPPHEIQRRLRQIHRSSRSAAGAHLARAH